jgi:hypothetical protein
MELSSKNTETFKKLAKINNMFNFPATLGGDVGINSICNSTLLPSDIIEIIIKYCLEKIFKCHIVQFSSAKFILISNEDGYDKFVDHLYIDNIVSANNIITCAHENNFELIKNIYDLLTQYNNNINNNKIIVSNKTTKFNYNNIIKFIKNNIFNVKFISSMVFITCAFNIYYVKKNFCNFSQIFF